MQISFIQFLKIYILRIFFIFREKEKVVAHASCLALYCMIWSNAKGYLPTILQHRRKFNE